MKFEPTQGGPRDDRFWDETVPDLLEQAVLMLDDRGTEVMYDAVVVDEAQDFAPKWWYSLTQFLLSTSDSPLYAFLDPNQSLRGEVKPPPVPFEKPFRLTMNCRNTRKIAAATASVLELKTEVFNPRARRDQAATAPRGHREAPEGPSAPGTSKNVGARGH